jgi:hypothetical protein
MAWCARRVAKVHFSSAGRAFSTAQLACLGASVSVKLQGGVADGPRDWTLPIANGRPDGVTPRNVAMAISARRAQGPGVTRAQVQLVDHVFVRTTKPKAAAAVRISAGLGQQGRQPDWRWVRALPASGAAEGGSLRWRR